MRNEERAAPGMGCSVRSVLFSLSMFVTNDVALVTVVPLTLLTMMGCSEKAKIQTLVQETIAAEPNTGPTTIGIITWNTILTPWISPSCWGGV